ncbi:unnamed protein product [Albugo candida]|uniref:Secreted protein n=1 Tax=Albugo candida TaxID=65357 RepID=A0A024GS35_9STRA|nr:unnamed protein product [Albugo candida]|eukprot:CCI49597.1 unnamed protein product [Albugo candida]
MGAEFHRYKIQRHLFFLFLTFLPVHTVNSFTCLQLHFMSAALQTTYDPALNVSAYSRYDEITLCNSTTPARMPGEPCHTVWTLTK